MTYKKTVRGRFLERPNRFVAHVALDTDPPGAYTVCHVKNTGRCAELLTPGATVILSAGEKPGRKTDWDLVTVYKGERLINMDSQAPNRAAAEFLPRLFPDALSIRPEVKVGESRLDFLIRREVGDMYIEVKGVTLEEDGVVYFPDAPTQRGVKHLHTLERLVHSGTQAGVLFVIQMENVTQFRPNRRTHPAFADALSAAKQAGVTLHAYDCHIEEDSMTLRAPVPIVL